MNAESKILLQLDSFENKYIKLNFKYKIAFKIILSLFK